MNGLRLYIPPALLLIAALFAVPASYAQVQDPVWIRHIANGSFNPGLLLAWDGDAAVYGVGTLGANTVMEGSATPVLGDGDILICRWDTSGNLIWARTAGGECQPGDNDTGGTILYEPVNDQLIVTGRFDCPVTAVGDHILNGSGPLSGSTDIFIAGYDVSGDCAWARRIHAAPNLGIGVSSLVSDANGDIFIVGYGGISNIFFEDSPEVAVPPGGFVAKYASNGTLLSAERALANGDLIGAVWASPTEWYLCGTARPGASLFGQMLPALASAGDGFVARADTSGNTQWITMFPATGWSKVLQAVVLPDGSCFVSGFFNGDLLLPDDTLIGNEDVTNSFVALLSEQGVLQWALPFVGTGATLLNDIEVDGQGNLYYFGRFDEDLRIGQTNVPQYGSRSGFVARTTSGGQLQAVMTFGRVRFGSGSILSTNHGLYLSADFDSTLTLGSTVVQGTTEEFATDFFLARFDSISGFTGVQTIVGGGSNALHIYANPNNGICTVDLPTTLRATNDLVLSVYDNTGQLVQSAPLVFSDEGIRLDIRAQARGIYHVELGDGSQRYTGTIVFE